MKFVPNFLVSLMNQVSAIAQINLNLTSIQTVLEDALSKSGQGSNQMGTTLDMNNNRIINLPSPVSDHEPVIRALYEADLSTITSSRDISIAQAGIATQQAGIATTAAAGASGSAAQAKTYRDYALGAASNIAIQNKIPLYANFVGMNLINVYLAVGMVFQTQGYNTPGDGGAATYIIVNALPTGTYASRYSGTTKDGLKFMIANASPVYTIEQFGGVADGTINSSSGAPNNNSTATDNLPALNAALEIYQNSQVIYYLPGSQHIVFKNGIYYFSGTITPRSVTTLQGTGTGTQGSFYDTTFNFPADTIGIAINQSDTDTVQTGPISPRKGSAGGSSIIGINFNSSGGTVRTAHGALIRTACTFEKCNFTRFPGNGVNMAANTGYDAPNYGNCCGSRLTNIYVYGYGVTQYGYYVRGNNSNASSFVTIGCVGCQIGIREHDTLGNHYFGVEIDGFGNGAVNPYVKYNGVGYILINDQGNYGSTVTPGTNDTVWYPYYYAASDLTNLPTWVSGGTYTPALPIYCTIGQSIRSNFSGVYTEGGLNHAGTEVMVQAGQSFWTRFVGGDSVSTVSSFGAGQSRSFTGQLPSAGLGTRISYNFGAGAPNGIIFSMNTQLMETAANNAWVYQFKGQDIKFEQVDAAGNTFAGRVVGYTGNQTTELFQRYTPQAGYAYFPKGIMLGNSTASNDGTYCQSLSYAGAAPQQGLSTGQYARGEIVFNTQASPGGNAGFICVQKGTTTTTTWYSRSYGAGEIVTNGGNNYICTTAGTSTTGPTGTGTYSDGATGSAVWGYTPTAIFKSFGVISN